MKLPKSFYKVTTLSKTIALVLFVSFPFIGFVLGMQYQQGISQSMQPPALPTSPPPPHITMMPTSDGQISLTSLAPIQGPVGTQITLTGSGFTQDKNFIFLSQQTTNGPTRLYLNIPLGVSSPDGKSITFPLPATRLGGCYLPPLQRMKNVIRCMIATFPINIDPGVYQVGVVNENGTSNTQQFEVK